MVGFNSGPHDGVLVVRSSRTLVLDIISERTYHGLSLLRVGVCRRLRGAEALFQRLCAVVVARPLSKKMWAHDADDCCFPARSISRSLFMCTSIGRSIMSSRSTHSGVKEMCSRSNVRNTRCRLTVMWWRSPLYCRTGLLWPRQCRSIEMISNTADPVRASRCAAGLDS